MPKKKMSLMKFAERFECSYSAAGIRLKKLLAKDRKFAKHVTRKGRMYLLDDYAAEILKPKTAKKNSVSGCDIEKLKEEQQLLAEKHEKITEAVYKVLDREYMPDDEKRIYEYLSGCDDFKVFMNSKTKETENDNGIF